MSEQIVSELNVLETTGIEVYDASTCTTALVIAPFILINLSVTTHVHQSC